QNKQLEEEIKELEAKIKRRNGQSDVVLVKEQQQPVHPAPMALKTPPCFKKEQPLIPVNDAVRTIEGSNTADNRYSEFVEEYSKAEPAVVSLEYGVARMTC
ncbi:MTMR6 protein, partial [Rissa tridactyla]|nr:MTMR6 protein [Chroicocephalus maculipennis]NXV29994.1 MTMR6 protein [Rissa tridactyla]NXX03199.1 MTMR6 protein [Larus smithsonianus]